MKRIAHASALATVLLASSTQAANFGYSTLGVDLTSTSFDNDVVLGASSFSGTSGVSLYGSYQLNENFFLLLNITGESDQVNNDELTSAVSYFGVGFALPVGSRSDVVMRLAAVSAENEWCNSDLGVTLCISDDDSGYGAGIGIRHMATANIEVKADFTHVELDQWGETDILSIGGGYWFTENHSMQINFGDSDDSKTFALGYRYTF